MPHCWRHSDTSLHIAGGAGLKRGRHRSALLCWLDGLHVAEAGAWLLRLRPADGSGSRKPLLGSATAKDTAGATAAASAGLTASATGVEASTPQARTARHALCLRAPSWIVPWSQCCLMSCS